MASKDMKRSSISLAIREMEIKAIGRYLYTPIRMTEIKNISTNNSCTVFATFLFLSLFLTVLGLCSCAQAFSSCLERGLLSS